MGAEIGRALAFVVALAVFGQAPSGVFESQLWPGEGRPQFLAGATDLAIHEAPMSSARVVRRLAVMPGQDIAFDETRYRTIESGTVQVLARTHITGRVLGPIRSVSRDAYYKGRFPREAVACKQGDVIEYLQDRAEGTCFVRVGDQVVDADPCPAQDDAAFRVVTKPKTEWWIRVAVDRVPLGWALVDGNNIKQNARKF
jgi:hypothetical protein